MAERNPIYTPDFTTDTIQYKPLSLLAVAGLSLAGLFAVVVVACAIFALLKGQPFFLPTFFIFLPVGSAFLSGLGLWEVYYSEGTRAGAQLAKWGLWVSVIVGAGYFTYQTFTGLAIIQQGNRFLLEQDADSGFFERLKGTEVDVRTAFLLTLPLAERQSLRPENQQQMEMLDFPNPQTAKGRLTNFMESPVVKTIRQATPGKVKIEPLAVKEWNYENGSYKIFRTYRITTDDSVIDVPVVVTSQEAEAEGEKRKWKVDWMYSGSPALVSRTAQGFKKVGLRKKAFEFLQNPQTGLFQILTKRRGLERGIDLFLAYQLPRDRKELRAKATMLQAKMPLVAAGGVALAPLDSQTEEKYLQAFLPGYVPVSEFADKRVDLTNLRFADPAMLSEIRTNVVKALSVERLPVLPWELLDDEWAAYEVKNGEALVTHQFAVTVSVVKNLPQQGPQPIPVKVFGKIVLAASDQLEPTAANADMEWRIVKIELYRAVPLQQKQ